MDTVSPSVYIKPVGRLLKLAVVGGGTILILFSIVIFMLTKTSNTVSTLISTQNDASLKLRADLNYYEHYRPRTEAKVTEEGMYQIELYLAIRDHAQDKANFYKDFLDALSLYAMPVFYALLGASLWAFRSASRPTNRHRAQMAADRSRHYVMAAIAGIGLSVLGPLLPNDTLLSPVAMAFLVGYATEGFTSRLDDLIAKMVKSKWC
ncbi:MAG: hypothetical protein ABSC06_06895 [Rhodopila sp.]|jgi:hypothetical protein